MGNLKRERRITKLQGCRRNESGSEGTAVHTQKIMLDLFSAPHHILYFAGKYENDNESIYLLPLFSHQYGVEVSLWESQTQARQKLSLFF